MEMTKVPSQQAANIQENTSTKEKTKEGVFAGILKAIQPKDEKAKAESQKEGQAKEKTMDLPAYMLMGLTNLVLDKESGLENNMVGLQKALTTANGQAETKLDPDLVNSKVIAMDVQKEIPKEIPKEMLKEVLKEIPGQTKNQQVGQTEKPREAPETGDPNKASKASEPKVFSLEYREINLPQKSEGEKSGKIIVVGKSEEKALEESGKLNQNLGKTNTGKNDQAPIFNMDKAETAFKVQGETPAIRNTQDNATKVQEAMIKLFETTREGQTTKMRVSLHPASLGKVDIGLTMEGGKLTASIQVESNQIRELFTNKMAELNQNLARQGLVIEKIHVEVKVPVDNLAMNMNQQGNFNQQGKRQWTNNTNNIFKTGYNNIKDTESVSLEKGVSVLA